MGNFLRLSALNQEARKITDISGPTPEQGRIILSNYYFFCDCYKIA